MPGPGDGGASDLGRLSRRYDHLAIRTGEAGGFGVNFFFHKVWLMVELGQIVLSCVTLLSVGCNSCIEMFPGLLAFEVILYCRSRVTQ